MSGSDLDAYFARIGYTGPRTPTLATLSALHPATIPFENIDVLLDRGIDIAPAAVEAKLVAGGRGGYCYEHNGLFKRVLAALGFEVEALAARVHWRRPPGATPLPRTHMALRVLIEGEAWLADVGFGGIGPTAPLHLATTAPQPTRHETWRLVARGDWLMLEARLGDEWKAVYELSPAPQRDVDFVPANWYTSTHPDSPFRAGLTVALTTPRERCTLSGNRLSVRTPEGDMKRRSLGADALERVLVETFGLPRGAELAPHHRTGHGARFNLSKRMSKTDEAYH